jgi:hypothetical protein
MTTNSEVKRLLAPLLTSNPDLAASKLRVGRLTLIVRPVRHILRAVFIDRTSDATRFRPWWLTIPLFRGFDDFVLIGHDFYPPVGLPWWNWTLPESIDGFYRVLEADVLPRLRACQTPSDIVTVGRRKYMLDGDPSDAKGDDFLTLLADGRISEAVASLDIWYDDNDYVFNLDAEAPGLAARIKEEGDSLSPADRRRIAEIFRVWERRQVEAYGINHLWEETPFGIEAGSR